MSTKVFISKVAWKGSGVGSRARVGRHSITIDEPQALGGADEGPNPAEVLLSALGSCLNVMLVSFAKQHDVLLKSVNIAVEGDLDPDGFLEKADVRSGFQDIRYRIEIDSPSPTENVQALLTHVERICPMKDTLRGVPVTQMEPVLS